MWVIDHEADVESDLSVFHRVDDPMTLDGPRYFALAVRLAAYAGVMQARIIKAKEDERGGQQAPASPAASTGARPAEKVSRVADDTALAMLAAEGWVEHEKGEA